MSEVFDDAALKRLPRAGHIAACVQDGRDVLVSVSVEELIDQRDDLRAGLPKLPGVERSRQRERRGGAPAKTDVRGQAIAGFDERDIVHEQADHAFPFAIGRVRIVP